MTCACCQGACCFEGEEPYCEVLSREACLSAGGKFQGYGTACTEEEECPCDPPADYEACERCDGEGEYTYIATRCSFGQYCCDGECQDEPCDPCGQECVECGESCVECTGVCDEEAPCAEGCECVDGQCQPVTPCPEDCQCVAEVCEPVSPCPEECECIDGTCVEITCSGECASDEDCGEDCVCVEGECVDAGSCCFKSVFGSYSFSVLGDSGTLVDGIWDSSPPASLSIYCTGDAATCSGTAGDGLFIEYDDGTGGGFSSIWRGFEAGNHLTHPCESAAPLAGTYTLTNCITAATATLTIT
jgi:hypothetical protein